MIAQEETAPHFEQITRALGNKVGSEVSEAEIKEQFEKFLQYGVTPEQAVRSLIRQYGGGSASAPTGGAARSTPSGDGPAKLSDVEPGLSAVDLLVRVVHVTEREINVRGEAKTIWTGIFGDDTGTKPFTSWEPFGEQDGDSFVPYVKGDVLAITDAYTKEFNNETQINIGNRVTIEKQAPDALPEYNSETVVKPIGELEPGIGRCIVTGRVVQVDKRTVIARGEEKTITTGTLADTSGRIPFTAWSDLELNEGQVVTIDAGYIKAYRGVPQFNFDDGAEITVQADDALPAAAQLAQVEPVTLGQIIGRGGGSDVTVHASIIEVRPGSGLVFRDPETNRVIQDHAHSDTEGTPDLRIKAILDDGTGALNAIIMRNDTEALYGKTVEEALTLAKETMDWAIVADQIREKVTGRKFEVSGNVLQDDFGMTFIVQRIQEVPVDVQMRAAKLASRAKEIVADLFEGPQAVDA